MNKTYFILPEKNKSGNESNAPVNAQDAVDYLNMENYEPMEDLLRDDLYVWKLLFLVDKREFD
jgi:hypothetical protein